MEEHKKIPVVSEAKVEKIDDDEDQEEEEVDKFISLVQKFREARNRRKNEPNELAITTTTTTTTNDTRNKGKSSNCKQECSGWMPKFEMQDFVISSQVSAPANNCNSKQRIEFKEGSKEENEGEGSEVDLRLTL